MRPAGFSQYVALFRSREPRSRKQPKAEDIVRTTTRRLVNSCKIILKLLFIITCKVIKVVKFKTSIELMNPYLYLFTFSC